ncbi:MAG: phosphotransferase [Rhodobacteraceae bacterium]|nr:phosphotransferase [Paracoccaceae bacterium]
MKIENHHIGANAAPTDWRSEVSARLDQCYASISRLLDPSGQASEMDFVLLKAGRSALSLRCSAGPGHVYVKLFTGPETHAPYHKEKASLAALRDSGLVPRLLAFSDERHFIVTEWIEQADLDPFEALDPSRAAEALGVWIGEMDSKAPGNRLHGNWYSYLKKFGDQLDLDRITPARELLSNIPLCGSVLSRNDAALHNFIFVGDGELLGFDFDKAKLCPRGWDYIHGFIALIQRYPDDVETVLEAYSQGFARAHRGVLLVDELNSVARALFCATAIVGRQKEEALSWL